MSDDDPNKMSDDDPNKDGRFELQYQYDALPFGQLDGGEQTYNVYVSSATGRGRVRVDRKKGYRYINFYDHSWVALGADEVVSGRGVVGNTCKELYFKFEKIEREWE